MQLLVLLLTKLSCKINKQIPTLTSHTFLIKKLEERRVTSDLRVFTLDPRGSTLDLSVIHWT